MRRPDRPYGSPNPFECSSASASAWLLGALGAASLVGACQVLGDGAGPAAWGGSDAGFRGGAGSGSGGDGGGAPGGGGDAGDAATIDAGTFQAISPAVSASKVKSLLTGLAATSAEIAQVTADPSALKSLIQTWQKTPEYQTRMIDFFTMAFQQGDVTAAMVDAVTSFEQIDMDPRVVQSMRESFGRTAMELVNEGAPFTDVLTTNRFMLTPALMLEMAWLDERQSGDQGGGVADFLEQELGAKSQYTMQASQVPISESADPTSASFLKFYSAQVAAGTGNCNAPIVIDQTNRGTLYTETLGETMMAFFMGRPLGVDGCSYPAMPTVLQPADFTTWRMVTVRQPKAGEKQTFVYQVPTFLTGTELVLLKPHVGFYTTPAFLYTWQSNASNQARVTANQALVVALGQAFDGTLSAVPVSTAAIDTAHAVPGTDCYGCHVTMDPMRQYFRATYSYQWDLQTDSTETALPGVFAFDGQSHAGADISDLGASFAQSKWFATAWAHKLCTWANGMVCDPSGSNRGAPADPELQRIAAAFVASNYDWNVLVQELFSSPLTTNFAPTATTTARGQVFSVAKRDHLCELLDSRLGLADSCGLHSLPSTTSGDPVVTIATVLPSDSYSRGQTVPTLANDPGMFFYASVQNVCATLAPRVVDASGSAPTKYASAQAQGAIADMVHTLMGLPAPDDQDAIGILTDHFQSAQTTGASATDALRSTFILACMSPSTVGVGQ